MALGQWFAAPRSQKKQTDLRGVPEETARLVRAQEQIEAAASDDDKIEAYLENVSAFTIFADMRTQWVMHGMTGMHLGLHYPSLDKIPRWRQLSDTDRDKTMEKIMILERTAMAAWAEQRKDGR